VINLQETIFVSTGASKKLQHLDIIRNPKKKNKKDFLVLSKQLKGVELF